jgi:polyhydroxyalkanoate synthase
MPSSKDPPPAAPSAGTAWFDLASALGPERSLAGLFRRALPPLPALADAPAMLAQATLSHPERYQSLAADYYRRQMGLWESLLQPTPASATTDDESLSGTKTLASQPWFRFVRNQHALWVEWMGGMSALLDDDSAEARRVRFVMEQWIEASNPDNFFVTNPAAVERALDTEGESVRRGMSNLAHDIGLGRITMSDGQAFQVGVNLATTEGSVIHETAIAQLIRYRPTTPTVHRAPLLIVPPFINRYYVLDLQPDNSFVRHALASGFQVFMVSWRSACAETAASTWADYVRDGVLSMAQVAMSLCRTSSFHLLGYCVGGTLAASAAAALSARPKSPLASLTLLNTMLDFSEPGEIGVYLGDPPTGAAEGAPDVFPGSRLAAAFASLRARELIWHFVTHNYLLGETPPPLDLLHWNGDAADIPGPLFREYLRDMYQHNRLREPGALSLDGTGIDLGSIRVPAYVLAAKNDHIVPWQSALHSAALLGAPPRFVLTQGGHIAGVVNPPSGRRVRGHWTADTARIAPDADRWFDGTTYRASSWWQDWAQWIGPLGGAMKPAPRTAGSARHPVVEPAPGRYVLEPAGAAATSNGSTAFPTKPEENDNG